MGIVKWNSCMEMGDGLDMMGRGITYDDFASNSLDSKGICLGLSFGISSEVIVCPMSESRQRFVSLPHWWLYCNGLLIPHFKTDRLG